MARFADRFFAGILALLVPSIVGALATTGCARSDDPTAPQPRKVYKDGFATPIDSVEIVADGGTIIGAYDAWIVVAGSVLPAPRGDGDYRAIDCKPVVEYFEREMALANRPLEISLVGCRQATNERLPFDNGRWVADSVSGDRLFYRVWKYR